jgi:hypothetical protein
MTKPLTLGDFLSEAGAQVYFFDLGRRVTRLPNGTVAAFEQAQHPYPYPFLRSAWLGVLFCYEGEDEQQIWFLRFPLDEQGLLLQAARDDFLSRIMETMGQDPRADKAHLSGLEDNPHGFKPRQDRMAVFHAKAAKLLSHPPSQYYTHAAHYFTGADGYEQWNFVGLQGIADVAARLDEDGNGPTLVQAMHHLPAVPFEALCGCLENEAIDAALTEAIGMRITQALEQEALAMATVGIRGISHSKDTWTLIATLDKVLQHPLGKQVDILAAIAGRAWEALQDQALRRRFLDCLAQCEAGPQAFDAIMSDLLFIPGLREQLLDELRAPDRSAILTEAVSGFFQRAQQSAQPQ